MQIYELVQFLSQVKAPLINCIWPLRDLKRSGARRASPAMAVALGKKCNAATVRFRARPSGPTGCSALRVASFRQADACLDRHGWRKCRFCRSKNLPKWRLDCETACRPEAVCN
jgi:hypothetical protein